MIQEAVLQLSVLRQDGAVLMICQQDVKISDVFTVKGELEMTSKSDELEKQNVSITQEALNLSTAKLPQDETQMKSEKCDAAVQSDYLGCTDAIPKETSEKDTQANISCPAGKVFCDAEIQTQNTLKTENAGIQTDDNQLQNCEAPSESSCSLSEQKPAEVSSVEVQTKTEDVVNNQSDNAATAESSLQRSDAQKPVTEDMSTQTERDDGPVIDDLLARIEDLQAQQKTEEVDEEPSTSDGPSPRKRPRKRLFERQLLSSTEVSDEDEDEDEDNEIDDDDVGEDAASEEEYEPDKSFSKVTKQWNKDLQSVIASLAQDVTKPDKMTTRGAKPANNVKNNASSPRNSSKRKRGRPRKVPQEVKPESSEDEDESPTKDSPQEKMTVPKKKKGFQCSGCGEIFPKRALLARHKPDCTAAAVVEMSPHEKTGVFQCPTCDKTYTKMSHMRRHQKSHTDVREHVCQYCSKAFFRKEHKDTHELTHQSIKCQYCEEVVIGKANLKRHEKSHFPSEPMPKKPAKKTTPCRYCGKLFGGRAQCEQHEITHTNEKPYKCSYCDLSFSKRGNTLKHERRIHLRLKPYLCQYCGKAFAQKPDCKKHEMRHLGEKRVKCSYCEKMFLENHHRIVHERTHTGERPYKCVICNHAFAQSYDCKKHMRIHLKDKGAKQGSGTTTDHLAEAKAVEYLQLQVRQAKAAVMESNSIQQQQLAAQQQQEQQQQQAQQAQQQAAVPQQHVMEGGQMYPIYDYQTISANALNPEYMMQAVAATSTLHQIVPQAPAGAVFAPHHELQGGAAPFMQNAFDIRKMQDMMSTQNNADNSGTKLMP